MQYGQTVLHPISINKANKTQTNILPKFLNSSSLKKSLENAIKIAFVGLGQAGGRIAREAAELGFPAFIVNTSLADMREHENVIPKDNMYYTPLLDADGNPTTIQGTGKDAAQGTEIAKDNYAIYEEILQRDEIKYADFVFVCTSIGGGSGAGAMEYFVPRLMQFKDEVTNDAMAYVLNRQVGIIPCLPASSERGVAVRENARKSLELINYWVNEGWVGAVLPIDNEHLTTSTYTSDYLSTFDPNIDPLTLGNSRAVSLLFTLISTFHLENTRGTVDSGELLQLLGTSGYLNIKEILNDEVVVRDFKKATTEGIEADEIIKAFCDEILESENYLSNVVYKEANVAIMQFIEPFDYPRILSDKLTAAFGAYFTTATSHKGYSQMKSQNGLSLIMAYNTLEMPGRFGEIITELETEVALEQEKLRKIEERRSTNIFAKRSDNNSVPNARTIGRGRPTPPANGLNPFGETDRRNRRERMADEAKQQRSMASPMSNNRPGQNNQPPFGKPYNR